MTQVSIVSCRDYELENLKRAILSSIDLIGGLSKYIKKTDSVLLKANMLMSKKQDNITLTNTYFVEAMIVILREYGVEKIVLGDSPALETAEHVAKISGMYDVCKKHGVKIINLKAHKHVFRKENITIKNFIIAKELEHYDKIINLPKLKTHSFTSMTGATKNLFGCIPGTLKFGYHFKLQDPNLFSSMLIDLRDVIKPTLNIMDAIIGMQGQGPSAGKPKKVGLVLASEDTIAMDCVASYIYKIPKVPLLEEAKKRGIKESHLDNIKVVGKDLQSSRVKKIKLPSTTLLLKIPKFLPSFIKTQLF